MGRVITITGAEDWKLVRGILEAIEAGASRHALMRRGFADGSSLIQHVRLDVSVCFTGEEQS